MLATTLMKELKVAIEDMNVDKELNNIKSLVNDTYDVMVPAFDQRGTMTQNEMRTVIQKLDAIENMVSKLQQKQ